MNLQIILGLFASFECLKIDNLYALGDSVTDSGGLASLGFFSGILIKAFYPTGRYTDDLVWVEYLRDEWNVTNFRNYAVATSTSDNRLFNKHFLTNDVPGCIQQAKQLINLLKARNHTRENTMVSIAFFGNELLNENGTVEAYANNIYKCIDMIADTSIVGHIVVPTSVGTKYLPYLNDDKRLQEKLIRMESELKTLWPGFFSKLVLGHAQTRFYNFDFEAIIKEGVDEKLSLVPCFHCFLFSNTNQTPPPICDDAESHVYYDQLHPSSTIHKKIAKKVQQLFEQRKFLKMKCKRNIKKPSLALS